MNQLALKQARLQREEYQIRHHSEREEAWKKYQNSLEALEMQTHNVEAAREIYQTNLLGYREQVVSLTDLLLSENQLAESRMSYYKTAFEFMDAELRLKKLEGRILE